ncbi:uncharacterized protein LOC143287554 isoform X2 [Babylonia areolata]|uniref:uncharacterized protein LOC143287554 isoform X2 n=1 Tax=Babylonia areolata TaxID=304850 RepID=UPI003FD4C965
MAGTRSGITMHRISLFCFISILITMATAGLLKKPKNQILTCSRHCRVPKESHFRYEADRVYDYSYKVEVATHMATSPQHAVRLLVEAVVNVHVLGTCDMLLKFREVRIMESDPEKGLRKADNSKHFRQELEKEALRFAFQDGRISDICPSDVDSTWALNVKRGFLSAFQNNMEDFNTDQTVDETDVLGTCLTVYHTSGTGWFSNTIKKSRDLANCSSSSQSSASVVPLHPLHSTLLPSFLSGRQDCQQTIDWNGVLASALCVEQRHFRPLSGTTNGSVTKVSQMIKFLQKRERGQFFPPVYKRMGLQYDSTVQSPRNNKMDSEEALRTARATLRKMCLPSEILPDTPDLFYDLVTNVRRLSHPGLRVLYEKVSGPSLCSDHARLKKFFLDALAMAGTEPAVRLLVKALTTREQGPVSSHFLLSTLAFLPSVTSSILQDVRSLLEYRPTSEAAMLPVSSMVYRYCQQYGQQCDSDAAVQRIMLHFRRAVGTQCLARGPHGRKIVLGLRAIGNAGRTKRMTEVLTACLKRKNNPLDVRVAAMQAFRRMSCEESRERAQQLFEDTYAHTELRIAAYLTMMQCASMSQFTRLQRTLATESNIQVVSYVFTHLTNLKETSEELRDDAERVLTYVDFASKQLGRLQLSRHFAGSVFSDRVKLASSLLWPSQNTSHSLPSWLPRSLSANLTLNILGQTVDLAEVGVRGEGLEIMIGEVLMPMIGLKERSMGPKKRQDSLNQLKASVYSRILGNDLFHFQLSGTGNFMQRLTSSKKLFSLKALISKIVAEGKTRYSQSLVLMDQKMTVPTSSGLPLTVSLNASLATQLQVLGSVDFRQAFAKPRSFRIDGAVKPSAALRISGSMALDARVTRAALRMTGTLHTNTILKGRARIERGRLVNVELDMPRKNMTVFDARTEITFSLGKNIRTLALTSNEQHNLEVCTGQRGVRITGLDLCANVQVPKSVVSGSAYHRDFLSYPSSVSVVLHKRDSLSKYRFFAQHIVTQHSVTSQVTFSTLGSEVDRTLDLCLDVNLKQGKAEVRMLSPWRKARLTGSLTSTPKKKEAQLILSIDETITHGVTTALTVRKDKLGVTYIPLVEVRHLRTGPISLTGSLHLGRFGRKMSVEVVLTGVQGYSPSFKGSLTNSKKEISLKGSVSLSPKLAFTISLGTFMSVSGKLATKVGITPFFFLTTPTKQLVSLAGKGDYRRGRSLRADVKVATQWTRPISLKYALARAPTGNQVHYRFDAEFKSSKAVISIDARVDAKHGQLLLTRVSVTHDIPALLSRDTISVVTKLAKRTEANYFNGHLLSSLKSKAYSQYNLQVKLMAELQPTNSRIKVYYAYGADPAASDSYVALTSKMRHDVKSVGNVILAIVATAEIPSENVNVELKASHSHSVKGLESKISIDFGDSQQTKTHLILINKSTDRLIIVGRAALFLPLTPDRIRRSRRKSRSGKTSPDYQLQIKATENDNDYGITTGAYTGKKKRAFIANLSIKKPVLLRRVQMYCKGNPYSKTYQEFEAEFVHTMHPLLADVMELVMTKEWAQLDLVKPLRLLVSVNGAGILLTDNDHTQQSAGYYDSNTGYKTAYDEVKVNGLYSEFENKENTQEDDETQEKINIKGGVDVKSTFVDLVSGSWQFAHTYAGSWHKTGIKLANGGDSYEYEISIKDNVAKWLENSGGKASVRTPGKAITTEWSHEYDGSKFTSTYLTSWSKRRQIVINLTGRLARTNQSEAVFGDIMLKTPWKPVKDLRVSAAHDTDSGLFRSKSTFRLNGLIRASHQITFLHTSMFTDTGVMVVTPWTKKVTGSVVVQHGFYPLTTTAEFKWSSRHHLSVTASADLEAWDDAVMSLNIKTTVYSIKRLSADITNKMYGENLVSEIKALYGGSSFSVENVLRRHDFGKLRLRMLSPFDPFRVVDTGYQFNGSLKNLSAHADFRIYPLVKKIEGSLVWVYDTIFSGKFRLDIPLKEFPFTQITTTSELKDAYRHSSIILKYHPSEVYAFNAKYAIKSLDEMIISIKTPHRSFDNMVLHFRQEIIGTSKDFSVKMSLPQEQKVVAIGQINMERQIRGTLSLISTFSGFKDCRAAFIYSFQGTELSFAGNLTTEIRSVQSRIVLLYENDTGMLTPAVLSDFSSVEGLIKTMNRLPSLQKCELYLQTASTSPLSATKSEDLKLLMRYNQHERRISSTFELDLALTEETKLFSNFSQNRTEAFFAITARYGHGYLVSSNTTVSKEESEMVPRHTDYPIRTPQLVETTAVQKGNLTLKRLTSSIFGAVDGITFDIEVHAPLPYNQIIFHTNFQRPRREFSELSANNENQNENRSARESPLKARVVGLVNHSETKHGAYFSISHETQSDVFETEIEIKTALQEADNLSFHFLSHGLPVNFSGSTQFRVNEKQIFKTFVKHMQNEHEVRSVAVWQNGNIDNMTLVFFCDTFENELTVDVSAHYNDTIDINGRYADDFSGEDTRKIIIDLRINSSKSGTISSSTNITFSESESSDIFCMVTNSTAWDNHANVVFLMNKQDHMQFSGRLEYPSNIKVFPQNSTEIIFTYKGDPNNFTSSIFLNHSNLNPVDMKVRVNYVSVLDMETGIILKSSVPYANDLNLAIKSSGNVQGDYRALMMLGWAPYKQISLDVKHKHLPSLLGRTRQTDIAVVTPFLQFQNGFLTIRHSRILTKIDNSVCAKVNGQPILDIGVSSSDLSALGVRQPLLSLFQRNAVVSEKPFHRMNIFVQWNLSNPNSKLHILTEYKTSHEADEARVKHITIKVTHPWKTLSAIYLSKKSPVEISGEGVLIWDKIPTADNKVHYRYSLYNKLTSSGRTYEGHCGLGTPFRSAAANGSWVESIVGQAESGSDGFKFHSAEGAFFWDADTDRQKQLVVTTMLTSGDTSSADIAVTIPVLSQTIRLKTDLDLKTKDTIWNSTTSLSYSQDPSKTLTLSTALLQFTGPEDGRRNYTMTTVLTQPSSLVDLGLTSHVFSSKSELSTSVTGWFLTTHRTVEKVVLAGVFRRLRRTLEFKMETPTRTSSITAALTNTKSCELKVEGVSVGAENSHGSKTLGFHVSVDPFRRSFLIKVHHDAESPSTYVAVEAWYVNNSAIRAEVYRPHVTGSVTDSAFSVRLNTSTLLHMHLSWRPGLLQDLRALSRRTLTQLSEHHTQATKTLMQTSGIIYDQLSLKWDAVRNQFAEDQPALELLLTEVALLLELKNNVSKKLDVVLTGNKDITEMLTQILEEASEVVRNSILYSTSSQAYLRATELSVQWLDTLKHSEIAYFYRDLLDHMPLAIAMAQQQSLEKLQEILYYADMYLLLVRTRMEGLTNVIYSLTENDMDAVRDVSGLRSLWEAVQMMGARAELWLAPLSNTTFLTIAGPTREFYQQVYHYLDLNSHLEGRLENIARSLKDIVLAELRFHTRHFRFLRQSGFTVWRPHHGMIQAQVCLPFPVQSLWTLPDFPHGWTGSYNELEKHSVR